MSVNTQSRCPPRAPSSKQSVDSSQNANLMEDMSNCSVDDLVFAGVWTRKEMKFRDQDNMEDLIAWTKVLESRESGKYDTWNRDIVNSVSFKYVVNVSSHCLNTYAFKVPWHNVSSKTRGIWIFAVEVSSAYSSQAVSLTVHMSRFSVTMRLVSAGVLTSWEMNWRELGNGESPPAKCLVS